MNLISPWNLRFPPISIPPITASPHCKPSLTNHSFSFPFWPHPCRIISTTSFLVHAKKRNSKPEPVLKPTIIEQVSGDDEDKEEQLLFDDFEDGSLSPKKMSQDLQDPEKQQGRKREWRTISFYTLTISSLKEKENLIIINGT
jgi:hypothetical protein